jgi:Flp pilus assembly secretin CpaC
VNPLSGFFSAPEHFCPSRESHRLAIALVAALIGSYACLLQAQAPAAPPSSTPLAAPSSQSKAPNSGDRARAAKLFLAGSKSFESEKFQEAMETYRRASQLDPSNSNYPLAEEVARNHAVTALIQAAAKDRLRGDQAAASAALSHAFELNPHSAQASEHLYELGDAAPRERVKPLYSESAMLAAEPEELLHTAGKKSFHLHTDQRQVIRQVFQAFGLETTFDESVRATQIRLDLDDATFEQATQTLALITKTFYVPIDAHRVIVARDSRENRQQFERQELETIYLSGLSQTELGETATKLAKEIFEASQAVVDPSAGTLTIRVPARTLEAFNSTVHELLNGRDQVMLDVRMIQLAHSSTRNTGAQLPQTSAVYNMSAEAASILNANQSLVQQIISSGLAAPGDVGAILGILLASGQVSSALFSGGIATFGGSCSLTAGSTCSPTAFALSPGTTTLNLSLNSSESRALDQVQLRLGDGEEGKLRLGERYPIETSSFSSISPSSVNIPGLNTAGASGALSSLLSGLTGGLSNIPMVEYQDLGLTLKATPRVLRNGDVALTMDMKVDALAGSSINDVPVLSNTAYSGVLTLKAGESVVVVSELDKSQSRAISGTPGISEIPGLNNLTGIDAQNNYSTLLIVITPHVIRSTQAAGHTEMKLVEKNTQAH